MSTQTNTIVSTHLDLATHRMAICDAYRMAKKEYIGDFGDVAHGESNNQPNSFWRSSGGPAFAQQSIVTRAAAERPSVRPVAREPCYPHMPRLHDKI